MCISIVDMQPVDGLPVGGQPVDTYTDSSLGGLPLGAGGAYVYIYIHTVFVACPIPLEDHISGKQTRNCVNIYKCINTIIYTNAHIHVSICVHTYIDMYILV